MPRPKSHSKTSLATAALQQFWSKGYYATSIDDLVTATKVSKHGIYADFGGKQKLFLACFDSYQDQIVTPAFGIVEAHNADLKAVASYFDYQIARAVEVGLPGPGCFVANSATEVAPHDKEVAQCVMAHNDRLHQGFLNALGRAGPDQHEIATMMVVFTNGLWSMSRAVSDPEPLRQSVRTFLQLIETEASK